MSNTLAESGRTCSFPFNTHFYFNTHKSCLFTDKHTGDLSASYTVAMTRILSGSHHTHHSSTPLENTHGLLLWEAGQSRIVEVVIAQSETRLRVRSPGNHCSIPGGDRNFPLLQNFQVSCRAYPAS